MVQSSVNADPVRQAAFSMEHPLASLAVAAPQPNEALLINGQPLTDAELIAECTSTSPR
jgi:hypothetical protein